MTQLSRNLAALAAALGVAVVAACSPNDPPRADGTGDAAAPAATADPAPPAAKLPPFKPVTTVQELMAGPIDLAAQTYWASVSITVDREGTHENFPETDEEWHDVWAAALTVAESGNLLMMAPRAVDDRVWMRLSEALVTVGVEAAAAAKAQDTDLVFDAGEKVYNVCKACHDLYSPE
jgi:hypothetical protein